MPTFRTEVPHQLGQEQAVARLKRFLDQAQDEYKDFITSLTGTWTENVCTFSLQTYGFQIDGTLTVGDESASLAGQLPLAASLFRGKIEQSIASTLRRELA